MRTRSAKQASKRVGRKPLLSADRYQNGKVKNASTDSIRRTATQRMAGTDEFGVGISQGRLAEMKRGDVNEDKARDLAELSEVSRDLYIADLAYAARQNGAVNCVYFIRMGSTDAVKVGKAWNGLARCAHLQISSPLELQIVAFVSFVDEVTMNTAEAFAHRKCAEAGIRRLQGEWFNMDRARVHEMYEGLLTEFHGKLIGAVMKRATA